MFLFRSRAIFWVNVVLFLIAISPAISFGQQVPVPTLVPCNGIDCKVCDIAKLAQNVVNAGIFIAVFLSAVLFAWAGFKYISAGGSGSKLGEAKQIFFNVMVGLIIILAAWLIVDSIIYTLMGKHSWNAIC